jgi:hypothetical protein
MAATMNNKYTEWPIDVPKPKPALGVMGDLSKKWRRTEMALPLESLVEEMRKSNNGAVFHWMRRLEADLAEARELVAVATCDYEGSAISKELMDSILGVPAKKER